MRFNGSWMACPDGSRRPVVGGTLRNTDGVAKSFPFLVDTGADSTVLSYEAVFYLGSEVELEAGPRLQGIGGDTPSVAVRTTFWLLNDTGASVPFGGLLLGRPYPAGDDLCILGRDLLAHFAVIVDRPGRVVCLLHGRHRYVIQEA